MCSYKYIKYTIPKYFAWLKCLAPTQDIYSDSSFLDSGCGDQMLLDNYVPPHLLPQRPYHFLEMDFSQTACNQNWIHTHVAALLINKASGPPRRSLVGAVLVGVGWLGETETNGEFLITASPNLLLFFKVFSEVSRWSGSDDVSLASCWGSTMRRRSQQFCGLPISSAGTWIHFKEN